MNAVRLERVAFVSSRLGEFVGEKELVAQIGQNKEEWPLVILKELVDNALDECEEAEIPPKIEIEVDTATGSFITADNGRGIPTDTVKSMLDYSVRVSTREAYVSPTRGAQGNASKTPVAMGFALDRTRGETVIEARGQAHHIIFEMDAVRREPKIDHGITASTVKTGTRVITHWPDSAYAQLLRTRSRVFLQMATDFIWLNPHLTLSCEWNGELCVNAKAADPGWRKWKACDQTSVHWYDTDRFSRYMAAHIARDQDHGRDRPLR
jgi:DNA topoisomerase VI subunit B